LESEAKSHLPFSQVTASTAADRRHGQSQTCSNTEQLCVWAQTWPSSLSEAPAQAELFAAAAVTSARCVSRWRPRPRLPSAVVARGDRAGDGLGTAAAAEQRQRPWPGTSHRAVPFPSKITQL